MSYLRTDLVGKPSRVTTTILGANGKLGTILAHFSARDGLGWRRQARQGSADILWSGRFDDPVTDLIFERGSTIVNMIGATGGTAQTMLDVNAGFVRHLLRKAHQGGVAHVILSSTAAVYGAGDGKNPFTESAPFAPLTPYAESKVAMEEIARCEAEILENMAVTILRIGNVAGADALSDAAKRHLTSGAPMPLHRFGDGAAPQRSYIGPYDFYRAVAAIAPTRGADMHNGGLRTLNLVHPKPVGLDDVLTAYQTRLMPELRWRDTPAPDHALRSVTLSVDQLEDFVSFEKYDNPADEMAQQVAELTAL